MDLHFCKRLLGSVQQELQQNGFGSCQSLPEVVWWHWASSLGFPRGSVSKMTLCSTSQLLSPLKLQPRAVLPTSLGLFSVGIFKVANFHTSA